jgi:hypothetical protein
MNQSYPFPFYKFCKEINKIFHFAEVWKGEKVMSKAGTSNRLLKKSDPLGCSCKVVPSFMVLPG